jgi:acyl carrier protein
MQTTESVIQNILHEQCGVPANVIGPKAHLGRDLGLDSLDVAELMLSLEKELYISIPNGDWHTLETMQDLIRYVQQRRNNGTMAYA